MCKYFYMKTKTEVTAAYCDICNVWIYSCARHHFNSCPAGCISIDGGSFYTKLCFKKNPPQTKKFIIKASVQELYDDWNNRTDKYGLIKTCLVCRKELKGKISKYNKNIHERCQPKPAGKV